MVLNLLLFLVWFDPSSVVKSHWPPSTQLSETKEHTESCDTQVRPFLQQTTATGTAGVFWEPLAEAPVLCIINKQWNGGATDLLVCSPAWPQPSDQGVLAVCLSPCYLCMHLPRRSITAARYRGFLCKAGRPNYSCKVKWIFRHLRLRNVFDWKTLSKEGKEMLVGVQLLFMFLMPWG